MLIVVTAVVICGCRESPSPAKPALKPADEVASSLPAKGVPDVAREARSPFHPISLSVTQRSTTDLPITDAGIRLTIGDITRGQVMASLSRKDGTSVQAPVSLKEGENLSFEVEGDRFRLELIELRNELVGNDSAKFRLSAAVAETPHEAAGALTEREKIERLIAAVEEQEDSVFIRNGEEHSAGDAAAHLRRKWEGAADSIQTAEDFIRQVASGSSLTGDPYVVRFTDGNERLSSEFLQDALRQIESSTSR